MIGYIYKITSPSKKIYIGQTKDIKMRFNSYRFKHAKSQTKIYNSLNKYGIGMHSFEVIYMCPLELLDYVEEVYIRHYNSIKNGLNCRPGGNASKWTIEMKEKFSKTITGRKVIFSEQAKENIRRGVQNRKNRKKGHKHSEETKLKMSEAKKDRVITKEWRDNLSKSGKIAYKEGRRRSYKGRILSEETKKKISLSLHKAVDEGRKVTKGKAVLQLTLDNVFIKEWGSITEAARVLNLHQSVIYIGLTKKETYTSKTFKWRYADTTNIYSPR